MHALIGIHAAFGEAGALAFLWVLVEILSPSDSRVRRASLIAATGILFLFLAWSAGGYYYLTDYQSAVKPVIKSGPLPWTHSVIMETKEHVFLFLPFLAISAWSVIRQYGKYMALNRSYAAAAIIICTLIVVMAFSIAGMGFMISSGFRSALEARTL